MEASTKYMLLKDSLEYFKEQLIAINRQILHRKYNDCVSEEDVTKKEEEIAELIKQLNRFANLYDNLQSKLKRYDLYNK